MERILNQKGKLQRFLTLLTAQERLHPSPVNLHVRNMNWTLITLTLIEVNFTRYTMLLNWLYMYAHRKVVHIVPANSPLNVVYLWQTIREHRCRELLNTRRLYENLLTTVPSTQHPHLPHLPKTLVHWYKYLVCLMCVHMRPTHESFIRTTTPHSLPPSSSSTSTHPPTSIPALEVGCTAAWLWRVGLFCSRTQPLLEEMAR